MRENFKQFGNKSNVNPCDYVFFMLRNDFKRIFVLFEFFSIVIAF